MVKFCGVRLPMTGKGSIHKHGSSGSEVAGDLSAKFPGNAVNRSFNALARGQFLQACPEILVVCADYFHCLRGCVLSFPARAAG